jgi:hypothetical protein
MAVRIQQREWVYNPADLTDAGHVCTFIVDNDSETGDLPLMPVVKDQSMAIVRKPARRTLVLTADNIWEDL